MRVFNLPDLGEGLQEAEIVEWHVKPGDALESDQAMVSLETDKAIVESMLKGKQAVIKGSSARGTATTDTYTLAGFGQVLAEIDKACKVKR